MSRTVTSALLGLTFVLSTADLCAQQDHGSHAGAHDHAQASGATPEISATALGQIEEVRQRVEHLSTTEAARAAGFRPALGWIPSMGTHWVSRSNMRDGFDLMEPDHLMFSEVEGEPRLVGVAYAFTDPPGTPMPEAFDGELDRWHDHPELARPDETLHMLHVWFMDSPDGIFAGHNPLLPFNAVGLGVPDPAMFTDPVVGETLRELGGALAVTLESTQRDGVVARLLPEGQRETIERHRTAVRELIPALREAEAQGDHERWYRLAEEGADHWGAIRGAYVDGIPFPQAQERIGQLLDELLAGIVEHEH